ncbi:DUF4402 domain-containing protein [Flavobacterium sp. ACAM 123]|jgi:hypothetical protein|uniref:DUF4402 domain-containing protein n=1 Tax=Flavobacterium sp. ACAM 123 TaxID=1189620 RepID=UPI0002E04219|nr:DUF4402 domain-containing protein [Flavobacterium sp. ACAM 123]
MRKIISIVTLITAVVAVSTTANAQASQAAPSGATVVTPISITNDNGLNFGNITVSSTTAGTVVMTPAGVRTAADGAALPTIAGPVAAAKFTVNGQGAYTYAITLPTSAITLKGTADATKEMTLGSFTSTPSGSGALTGGTQVLTVGGTLTVGAAQAADNYTNTADLIVTVNYL